MFIPDGYTEDEVFRIIEKAIRPLAEVMKFGHYDVDDMYQEGVIEALSILERFDPDNKKKCGLENFIRIHVRNRFINLRRNKLYRTQSPCKNCAECAGSNKECERYQTWLKRNNTKRALMECGELDHDICERDKSDDIERMWRTELYNYVLDHISMKFRSDLLKFIDGVHVPKKRYDLMIEEMRILTQQFSNKQEEGDV